MLGGLTEELVGSQVEDPVLTQRSGRDLELAIRGMRARIIMSVREPSAHDASDDFSSIDSSQLEVPRFITRSRHAVIKISGHAKYSRHYRRFSPKSATLKH